MLQICSFGREIAGRQSSVSSTLAQTKADYAERRGSLLTIRVILNADA